jgi:capsid protein
MPFNIAAGNSSGYNYASGRLDHQTYFKSIRVEQANCDSVVLDRILAAWRGEAELLTEFSFLRGMSELAHQWFWDGTEHVDPAKEATAQEKRLANNTTTLAAEYARQGKDWETELRQRAKEKQLMAELGLTESEATPRTKQENNTDVEDQRQAA